MKYIILILTLSFFGCSSSKKKDKMTNKPESISYNEQIEIFNSLGYVFPEEVTIAMILRDASQLTWEDETEEYFEKKPFSNLYYFFGWRDSKVPNYNYTNECIWFDLEFFDPNSQYKWFMERMGAITKGEISYTEIELTTDDENYEWISFKVNGKPKKWKLERTGDIDDSFVQRFSYLPEELKTMGRYTYFDNGGQQWVIDYATESEQAKFNTVTGLSREWLGEENHFNEPKK